MDIPWPVMVYGSKSCEDTQITLDRLRTLGIPFQVQNKEEDPAIVAALERHNGGQVRTPTVVLGEDKVVLTEPTMEALEAALKEAGYTLAPPLAVEFSGGLAAAPAPRFELPSTLHERLALPELRGRRRGVLFLAHAATCRICQGYARQLAAQHKAFDEFEARPVFILQSDLESARRWAAEFAPWIEVLADVDGAVKRAYAVEFAGALHSTPGGVMLLILDRFTAPRAGSFAPDAGGLISPAEVSAWLGLLDCECSE